MSVVSMMDISTAHIPKHTADYLDTLAPQNPFIAVEKWGDCGWIFWTGNEDYNDECYAHPELLVLLDHCRSFDIAYLKLDRDAEIDGRFPTFNWED